MKRNVFLKTFYCLLFLTTFLRSHAQKIYFSDTTNQWLAAYMAYPNGFPGNLVTLNFKSNATQVNWNGKQYTKLDSYFGDILVRDDTFSNKVFIKALSGGFGALTATDTNEFVYMNYNMNVGDTLVMPLVYDGINTMDTVSLHVATSVDSISLSGIWYKRIYFRTYGGMALGTTPTLYSIIEGVGPDSGPFIEGTGYSEWGPPQLACFKNEGIIPSIFEQTCFDPVSIKGPGKAMQDLQIFPNPAHNKIDVRLNVENQKKYQIRLVDIAGKILITQTLNDQTSIDIHNIHSGIYIVQLIENSGVLQSNKVIIQN